MKFPKIEKFRRKIEKYQALAAHHVVTGARLGQRQLAVVYIGVIPIHKAKVEGAGVHCVRKVANKRHGKIRRRGAGQPGVQAPTSCGLGNKSIPSTRMASSCPRRKPKSRFWGVLGQPTVASGRLTMQRRFDAPKNVGVGYFSDDEGRRARSQSCARQRAREHPQ